ncbi:FUSC family protein [Breznakiella homolactica]|uniref:FUSC family protein n=1 Tax=Breznakiella homolactica TaxID=2798577 RepID=A0A7T7XLS0_9SPIR|nr:FUSC family protein [Breznakiella homolactica]QQO08724.1 FUSC family protein [Breznakiella homolactica]
MKKDTAGPLPENGERKRRIRLPHIGMRSVKTVVAVFICCVIDYFRSTVPMQSTIAAILCIQPDTANSIKTAVTRIIGTILGGLAAALVLTVFKAMGWPLFDLPFYLVMSLFLFLLILIPVRTGFPEATALTCIVYLVIILAYSGERPPIWSALRRVTDTLVGILVALPVNLFLPTHRGPDSTDNTKTGTIAGRIAQVLEGNRKKSDPEGGSEKAPAAGQGDGKRES